MKKDIILITDYNYILPTKVTIESIKRTNKEINIWVLSKGLGEKEKKEFENMTAGTINVHVMIYKGLEKNIEQQTHVSKTALLKFELPYIFSDINRVLYLDSDIIVRGNLDGIFKVTLDECYAAVVRDYGVIWQKEDYPISQQVELYFNSGVMFLNLDKMRQDNITEQLYAIKQKHFSRSNLMDQDTLNIVFDGKICQMNYIYNCVNDIELMGKVFLKIISKNDHVNYKSFSKLYNSAIILHYASYRKPWIYKNVARGWEWEEKFLQAGMEQKILKDRKRLLDSWYYMPIKTLKHLREDGWQGTFRMIKKVLKRRTAIMEDKDIL